MLDVAAKEDTQLAKLNTSTQELEQPFSILNVAYALAHHRIKCQMHLDRLRIEPPLLSAHLRLHEAQVVTSLDGEVSDALDGVILENHLLKHQACFAKFECRKESHPPDVGGIESHSSTLQRPAVVVTQEARARLNDDLPCETQSESQQITAAVATNAANVAAEARARANSAARAAGAGAIRAACAQSIVTHKYEHSTRRYRTQATIRQAGRISASTLQRPAAVVAGSTTSEISPVSFRAWRSHRNEFADQNALKSSVISSLPCGSVQRVELDGGVDNGVCVFQS